MLGVFVLHSKQCFQFHVGAGVRQQITVRTESSQSFAPAALVGQHIGVCRWRQCVDNTVYRHCVADFTETYESQGELRSILTNQQRVISRTEELYTPMPAIL